MKVVLLSLAFFLSASSVQAAGSFFKYLQQSADRGEAESQFVLALAYRDGWAGVLRSGTIAAKWTDLATELGDQRAALVLGLLQRETDEFLPDETKALKLLGEAASQGDNYARVILGDMLLEGDGVSPDWRSGAAWIKLSAKEGFVPAQFRLGLIYLVGDESTPKDEIESLAWFIVAAEAGSKLAQEYRDERTETLGREVARLAVKRSRALLAKGEDGNRAEAKLVSNN